MRTSTCRALTVLMLFAAVLCGCATTGTQSPATDKSAAQETAKEAAEESTEDAEEPEQTQQRSSTSMTRAGNYRNEWATKTGSAKVKDDEGEQADATLQVVRTPAPKTSRYTLMVYMIGSNLESGLGAASEDIGEMLASGVDFGKTNVVVYTGGSRRWNSDIPADHNNVLDLSLGEGERIVAQTAGSANMGDAATLTSFLDFCSEHYPADHMALVFWDHGGGPLWGFGVDEVNGGDGLLLSELREAMEASPFGNKDSAGDGDASVSHKLDWVGFDACLMGSLESAALWSNYASMMVASEEVEPGDGWNWSYLQALNQTTDAKDVTKAILDGYDAHYKEIANTYSNPDVTLAAYDLSQVDAVVDALDGLAGVLNADVEKGSYGAVNRARHDTKAFGLSAVSSRAAAYDLVDLVDLAQNLEKTHGKEAKALARATQKLVVSNVGNVSAAHGVSLYFPGENRELFETYDEMGRASSQEERTVDEGGGSRGLDMLSDTYDEFVDKYTGEWLESTKVDWKLAEPQQGEDGPTLKLTDEQVDSFVSASYTLMRESEPGRYFVITSDVEVPLSDDGAVAVPKDPLVICSKTDLHRAVPGWFTQVEHSENSSTYVNHYLFLSPAGALRDFDVTTDPRVNVTVQVDEKTNDVSIQSVAADDGAVNMGGRSTVDVTKYSTLWQMHYGGGGLHVLYDTNDNPMPWEEWNDTGGFMYNGMPVEDGFGFVAMPASQVIESYAVQIVITDVNGNRHATSPISLRTDGAVASEGETVKKRTELGAIKYTVFDDHAELTQYEGDDWTVEIPAEIEGVPVTAIGEGAFSGARYLDELEIPEGIEDIGANAFKGSGLYTVTLPSTLKHVAPAAFFNMEQLTAFSLRGKNGVVSVIDGVLFSADGKTLITYPQAKGTSYVVPQGTEVIGYGSFAQSGIKQVTFPEGLKTIDRAAFYDCPSLTSMDLPQSLEGIGTLAFGLGYSSEMADIASVHLGPNVSYVGDRVFDGLNLQAIEVDPANTYYQSKGGCLLNAAGDAILEAPAGMGNIVEVPEGVVSLGTYTFYNYANETEFILPASLASCEEQSLPYSLEQNEDGSYTNVHTCVIHAPEGSYAERFAADRNITYDNITDRSKLVYNTHEAMQGDYVLGFRVYGDHAVLVSIVDSLGGGSSQHDLVIPAEVAGKPVTEISPPEYISFDDITGLPNSVVELTLPHTLKTVSGSGLKNLKGLKRLQFEGECPDLQVVDNVLFSADGRTLYAYPASREGASYEVPDGVKTIAPYAFHELQELKEVTLPKSVQIIGESAFKNCVLLTTVHFDSGLLSIGESAFQSCNKLVLSEPLPKGIRTIERDAFWGIKSYEGLELPKNVEEIGYSAFSAAYESENQGTLLPVAQDVIKIGKRLHTLENSVFDGLDITSFDVAKGNKSFKAEGPFLLTADGRSVVAYANGYKGKAKIPKSVRELNLEVFKYAYGLSELEIPPTVTYLTGTMSQNYSDPQQTANPDLVVRVQKGSTAERYAYEEGFAWVAE